jgi:hypothetical protein
MLIEDYLKQGLKIIPLYPKTKKPVGNAWNKSWNIDCIRDAFDIYNDANVGLLLGDIVDVEGDSPEANQRIFDLIGDYPHPCYKGSKSVHHLFLNPDPDLTRVSFEDIEFRGNKHQSVLPPSIHPDGTKYAWINKASTIPSMPKALMEFYNQIKTVKPKKVKKKKSQYIKPWCIKCKNQFPIHVVRFKLELEAFKELNQRWQCHKCRKIDLRKKCRKLRKTINNVVQLR